MSYELLESGNVKIGEKAPDFNAISTFGNISLKDYEGKWLVLFSHPGDFTPVCTTEMIAFTRANKYFNKMNTELLGLSVDSNSSHLAWVYDIYCRTGIKISFPIIADRNGIISRRYGMISNEISTTETVRNVYIIDDKQYIRAIFIYPMNIGRFIPEIIRTVKALQMAECMGGATAANWMSNQPIIIPSPKTYSELEKRVEYINKNRNGINWYLSFEEPNKKCIGEAENKEDKENKKEM